jgi:serine/threonine protein kinase
MGVSNKRKEDSDVDPLPNKIKKRPPPIRPYTTASLDDVAFQWTAADVQDHYRLETVLHPGHHLGFLKKYPHSAVVVQCTRAPAEQMLNLKPVIHRNVVQLRRVYTKGDSLSMVYEMTIASLNDILSFRPHWTIAETAAICHSVLSALKYLHGSLGISHGDLGVRSLRLDWNGLVKIG